MRGNQKRSYNGLIIALCTITALLVICLGGIMMYLAFQSDPVENSNRNTRITETEQLVSETDDSGEEYELFCEGVEEEHIAFDEETGLQFADNQLLITASSGVSKEDVEELIAPYQAEIIGMIEVTNIYQLKFPESYTQEELSSIGDELCHSGKIESYEMNTLMGIDLSAIYPNDTEWKNDWGDDKPSGKNWGMEAIHAPESWEYFDEMQEVNVGIYDNMFYPHKDLEFKDFLCNMRGKQLNDSHGTHVSGTIGAKYNNKRGVCGVFPKAQLYGASFEKIEGTYKYETIMGLKLAFTYLIYQKKCKVVNLSIGWTEVIFAASRNNKNALNAISNRAQQIGDYLEILLKIDKTNDFVICKAAGNENSNYKFIKADENDQDAPYGYIYYKDYNKDRYKKYEQEKNFKNRIVTAKTEGCVLANDFITAIPNQEIKKRILVVGAAENLGNGKYKVADFSNCGYRVDVLAPGVDIYSTVEKNKYEGGWDGTSMAAPHVAGIAAMCFSVNKKLSGAQVADIIRNTAEGSIKYTNDNGSQQFGGYPMVNAEKAVKKALETKEDDAGKEKDKGQKDITRDIVLVLDRSGSMEGDPLTQTKEAAIKFVDTVLKKESNVSVVTYDSEAIVNSGLTDDQQALTSTIKGIDSGGSTNMYAGLEQADGLLQNSQADRKIIVLMSDGLPNEGANDYGDYASPLLRYAEDMKNRGYYIYTLGFFTSVYGSELYSAQQLMEGIASPRLHYEVNSAEDLVFFFDDIADQISGTRYVYIRIACPVDVTVRSGGETLSSKAESENTRTSFGALTYESVQNEPQEDYVDIYDYGYTYGYGYDEEEALPQDQVKVLRLNMDQDYDVEIEGYDSGTMDYTVSFPNEKGEYDDVREFPNIAVTSSTKATSNTGEGDATYLKVDKDGDGTIDTTYKTAANGKMEEVEDFTLLRIIVIAVIAVTCCLLILIIILLCTSGKKKTVRGSVQGMRAVGSIYGAFGIFGGQSYPMCLGQQCVVGRKSTCDIQLVHSQVSRVHCVIEMLPDGVYQVTDYSSNGTFYNNQQLKSREPYRLPKGALLAIGDADNVLELR